MTTSAAPRTRIICTLTCPTPGGARPQDAPDYVERLVAAGMDCARLNLSHVPGHAEFVAGRAPRYEREEALLRRVRAASDAAGRHVAMLLDVQGVKIRMHLPAPARRDGLAVAAGETLRMRITRARPTDELSCDGPPSLAAELAKAVAERGEVPTAVGDGDPMLVCVGVEGDVAVLRVPDAARLLEGKGVTFRGVEITDEPPLTPKDRVDLAAFALPAVVAGDADFIALSFAQCAADVRRLRAFGDAAVSFFRSGAKPDDAEDAELLARLAALRPDLAARYRGDAPVRLHVCAKIETARGVADLDAVLVEADCVMVARGDLGLHCAPQEVPRHQKDVLRRARLAGREGVVATQMLASMERAPEPTRAEATDVFNAVLDGADALLLSNETAVGVRPAEAAATLARIVAEAETWERRQSAARAVTLAADFVDVLARRREAYAERPWLEPTDRLTFEAVRIAESIGAKAVVAATRSGATARLVARFDPRVAVVAVVPSAVVARRLALTGAVRAVVATDVDAGIEAAKAQGVVAAGDRVVVAGARPGDPEGSTSSLAVRAVP